MATWKKVIVSGSAAELSSLYATSITGSYISASAGFTGSLLGTASYVSGSVFDVNNKATYALTASYLDGVAANLANLTFGTGLSGSSYNGSAAVTVVVSGAAELSGNTIVKWNNTDDKFVNSTITDNGSNVTIASTASIHYLTVTHDLTVEGTASFTNAQNLLIADQFIALSSGSATLKDSGFVVVAGTGMTGSAFYLEADGTGEYGRFAVATYVNPGASAATADEYIVTTKISNLDPSDAPTWGAANSGSGNMWVNSSDNTIWIYA